tara:strand:+ start:126 stop:1685 length:1560 start_codon:yes stop_codon:yes gene_type:complete
MLSDPILNTKKTKINCALVSVFDKTNLFPLVEELIKHDVEILSTGGTAKILRDEEIEVLDVSKYTNFPEIMNGRVKTINPLIEGGILGLRDRHRDESIEYNIKWIDLVVCNLYPFHEAIAKDDYNLALALENIDIGGPTMLRSAAKNMGWVTSVVDPKDYSVVIKELNESSGYISFKTRQKFSAKTFGHSSQYDTIIHNYLKDEPFSDNLSMTFKKHSEMRYGENPHQKAAAYAIPGNTSSSVLNAIIHQGKKLSYNNMMDADGALACIREFEDPACVIVKHANPCGVAIGENLLDVYKRAFAADSISAFGGIVALNRHCSKQLAEEIMKVFVEIVIAPSFNPEALIEFKKKRNLRVLAIKNMGEKEELLEIKNINGGILVQDKDGKQVTPDDLNIVTIKQPSLKDVETAIFTWKVLKHAKSNGILIAKDKTTVGLGAGQVSRVDAVHMALRKGGQGVKGGVLASDAFFPFRDSIDTIKGSGIRTIIQPGGSIRDQEVIDACNEHGFSMVFTGTRCFKH